jgi:hypothetical protein
VVAKAFQNPPFTLTIARKPCLCAVRRPAIAGLQAEHARWGPTIVTPDPLESLTEAFVGTLGRHAEAVHVDSAFDHNVPRVCDQMPTKRHRKHVTPLLDR